jgi:peptidoglycan/LPS O-acetylase OafA/YrhL
MKNALHHNLSLYLDFLRLLAALVVFFTHAHNFLLPDIPLGPLRWGREAVAVFFVLSGFVISYVVSAKEGDGRSYAIARLARIYPVAVLAIAVTFVSDSIGLFYRPEYYEEVNRTFSGFYAPISWSAMISYLTFTNQLWLQHVVFGTDEPFWSLGFEAQYYVFFFVISFIDGKRRMALLAIWALFCGPKILLYLPLWLLGIVAKELVLRYRFTNIKPAATLVLSSMILFALARYYLESQTTVMFEAFDFKQETLNFLYFTLIGVAVMLNIVGTSFLLLHIRPIGPSVSKAIRWLAGGSFTVYLVHQPLLVVVSAFIENVDSRPLLGVVATFGVLVLCYFLAELAERRKNIYANFFRKFFVQTKIILGRKA